MTARFFDLQDSANPLNGTTLTTAEELRRVFESVRNRVPFGAELVGDAGVRLLLGLGPSEGFVQFDFLDETPRSDTPPYLAAVEQEASASEGEIRFLVGDTLTPVPRRFALPMSRVEHIAAVFVRTGQRALDMQWEPI